MIWVYGICDRPELPPPPPLEGLREGALMAVFTRRAHAVGSPAPDALWAHERIVEQLMEDRAVLPMRFGSSVDDEDALRRLLIERRQPLAAALARIAGRVELGVRVLERESAAARVTAGARTGREYLVAKLRDGRRANALHEPLAALSAEARVQAPRGAEDVLRGAYLVERDVLPRFRATVEGLQHAHPEVAILCTGPWPPYTFVGDA
jgi:hypothetical protein